MKKTVRLAAGIMGGAVAALLVFTKAFPPAGMLLSGVVSNMLFSDHSAERRGQDTVYWNGSYYDYRGEVGCREGKTIAKTADCNRDITEAEGDPSHAYIVVRSFLDQYPFVKRDG